MPWSGGTFSRSYDWTTDEGNALNIEADRMDGEDDNFAAGINSCLHKAGQNTPTADLPMGGQNHTGVGNATALDEYASADDVINQSLTYYLDSGSANAYVITPSPAISAYAEGQRFVFRAISANTGATTLNVNALGATAVVTPDGEALTAGMIAAAGYYEVIYDANGSRFIMMSPNSLTPVLDSRSVIAGTGLTDGGTLDADVTLNIGAGTGITVNADDIAVDAASALNVDHSAVSVIAGTGLTDGGTIDADLTVNVGAGSGISANANDVAVDISGLTTIEGNALAATDIFLVDDGANGTNKAVQVQEMGHQVQTSQTTQALAASDMNTIMQFPAASTLTLPATGLPIGTPVVLNMKHATSELTVTAAASASLTSVFHPEGATAESDIVKPGGTAIVYQTATGAWVLSGDIEDS